MKTILYGNEENVYRSMYNQIKQGHQCYVICPLIEDSDSDAMANVDSVETTLQRMQIFFRNYPEVQKVSITGKMKPDEVKKGIEAFSFGKAQILLATTIVEVGVNVPNATVMVIKNAERFGLAQLHQLRGRVGRGNAQGYCVLLSSQKDNERLRVMVETTDGFAIAQKDMQLRGMGDIIGVKQSGIDKHLELMLQNQSLYADIRKEVYKKLTVKTNQEGSLAN